MERVVFSIDFTQRVLDMSFIRKSNVREERNIFVEGQPFQPGNIFNSALSNFHVEYKKLTNYEGKPEPFNRVKRESTVNPHDSTKMD